MKKLLPILLFVLLVVTGSLKAQDEAIFNHYVQNPIILNPAAAGFNDEYSVFMNARAQWAGLDNGPKTIALRANGPIGESFGLGVGFFSETAAQQRRTKGQVDVSFRFGLGKAEKDVQPFRAAFGFFTEFQRISLDPDVVNNVHFEPGDNELMAFLDGKNKFDAGIGIYGTYKEQVFGGLTINNLVSNRLQDISGVSSGEGLNYTMLLGTKIYNKETKVSYTPSIMVRDIQGAPFMMDFNLQIGFQDEQFIVSPSYRYLGAVGILFGAKPAYGSFKGFRLYYSYDLPFGGLQQYSNGGHEITIGYAINRQDIKEKRKRNAGQQR
jgi:type IX secretion system PorP/SprF family membrane protein